MSDTVDAAVLAEWLELRLRSLGRRPDISSPRQVLAASMEIDTHTLYLWRSRLDRNRRPTTTQPRDDVEDALHRAGVFMWEVFPAAVDRDAIKATTAGQRRSLDRLEAGKPAAVYGKLTDRQMELLHRAHVEKGISVRELGRRIWRRAGFKTPHSAMQAILARWAILDLPIERRPSQRRTEAGRAARREERQASGEVWARRCEGTTTRGRPCRRWARPGKHYCTFHLEEVRP